MKSLIYLLGLLMLISACNSSGTKETEKDKAEKLKLKAEMAKVEKNLPDFKRIVVIGDEITELVVALGDSSKIVALARKHPVLNLPDLPKVGFGATLTLDNIVKLNPDAVFADAESASEEILDKVEKNGIPFFKIKKEATWESMQQYIREVAKNLKKKKKGEQLIKQLNKPIAQIKQIIEKRKDSLRVMYIHARGPYVILAGGANTPINTILQMAGAKNAAYDLNGMEKLTDEDMLSFNPDFIIMSKKGVESLQGKVHLTTVLLNSTAYRMGRILVLDDYEVMNLGLASGKTAFEICKKLYKENYYSPLPIFAENTYENSQDAPQTPKREKIKVETPQSDEDIQNLKGGGN
jgi:iron complex transport system substrate-binding protein